MIRLPLPLLVAALLAALAIRAASAAGAPPGPPWVLVEGQGEPQLQLYFFWSRSCPHCRAALPFVERLQQEYPWLRVHSHQLLGDRRAVALYVEMAAGLGQEATSVPAFLFCGEMMVGYDDEAGSGAQLRERLLECRRRTLEGGGNPGAPPATDAPPANAEPPPLEAPLLGRLEPGDWSLPMLTLVIAGLDAFNPCAFFVLLFLLSLLVHARSRLRMALVGGVFVLCSGLVYFLFMAAWLNLFLVTGALAPVTLAAGLIALLFGTLNVKDAFHPGQGPSLSLSGDARSGLARRVRELIHTARWPALLAATVLLALAANGYELLCTVGLPMVYTRILTLQGLEGWGYYLYLGLYNLVYVIPLAVIVALFTWTLGARKLSEGEGSFLKLLSGLMMVGLGGLLVARPEALTNPLAALGIIVAALLGTVAIRAMGARRA